MKPDKFPVVFVGNFGYWVFTSKLCRGKYYSSNGDVKVSAYDFFYLKRGQYPTISFEEFVLIKLEEE